MKNKIFLTVMGAIAIGSLSNGFCGDIENREPNLRTRQEVQALKEQALPKARQPRTLSADILKELDALHDDRMAPFALLPKPREETATAPTTTAAASTVEPKEKDTPKKQHTAMAEGKSDKPTATSTTNDNSTTATGSKSTTTNKPPKK